MPKIAQPKPKLIIVNKAVDNLYPLAIQVCWRGRKRQHGLGLLIPKTIWVNGHLSDQAPDTMKVTVINAMKALTDRIHELDQSGLNYSVDDIFSTGPIVDRSLDYRALYNELIVVRKLKISTKRNYDLAYLLLSRYLKRECFNITELNSSVIQGWLQSVIRNGGSYGYCGAMLRCVRATWNYALERNLVPHEDYPFGNNSNWYKKYKQGTRKTALTRHQVQGIEYYYIDTFFRWDGEKYVPVPQKTNPKEIYSYFFALTIWLLSYYLQGLAPIDVLNLKKSQFAFHNDERYVAIKKVRRQKTGEEVPIVVPYQPLFLLILRLYWNQAGQFLLPWGERAPEGEKTREQARLNFLSTTSKNLKLIWKRINCYMQTERHDVEWEDIPSDTTLYSARHSFATNYLMSNDSNMVALATMMGRSVNGIGAYIRELKIDNPKLREIKLKKN